MKNFNYKFLILCLFMLLTCTFLLTGCGKKAEVEEEKKQEQEIEEEQEENIEQEEGVSTGDFSKFSAEAQEIGNVGNEVYKITSFVEQPMEGFHRFTFEVEGEQNLPNVSANYRAELGAIRVMFKSIEEDSSGLGYQRSSEIDNQGIVRIFHNVAFNPQEEIYDIGVAKSTSFLLHSERVEDGKWKINLDVRYPGEVELEIDKGSDEFGVDEQNISGASASDGARITNYSFGVEDKVFRFIWTVRGSESNPIPQVRARYNDEGDLLVVFPDLDSDYIGADSKEQDLIGNVEKVVWQRIDSETVYRFTLKEKRDFRLSSSLSPNQVVLEVK